MNTVHRVFFAFVVGVLVSAPARADQRNALANALALEQAIDVTQTALVMHHRGTFEIDPLAKPFTQSVAINALAAGAINLWVRSKRGERGERNDG